MAARPVGKKLTLPTIPLHSSALSLTEAQTLAEVSRKYSTRWVDIQEKLLSLQDKTRYGWVPRGWAQAALAAPQRARN